MTSKCFWLVGGGVIMVTDGYSFEHKNDQQLELGEADQLEEQLFDMESLPQDATQPETQNLSCGRQLGCMLQTDLGLAELIRSVNWVLELLKCHIQKLCPGDLFFKNIDSYGKVVYLFLKRLGVYD